MFRLILILSFIFTVNVYADVISLDSWGLNINGDSISSVNDLPGNVIFSDDFFTTGTGTVSISFGSDIPEDFSVAMFLDHEIIQDDNTFFNEFGAEVGTSADSRLSYEIDEPGYGIYEDGYEPTGDFDVDVEHLVYMGDIYDNFSNFSAYGLDNQFFYDWYTDTYLSDFEDPISDDVSMAMGWNFTLNENETATLEFTVTNTVPLSGFYLAQLDCDSPETGIYFQSQLTVSPANVPEPSIVSLLGTGMVILFLFYRKRQTGPRTQTIVGLFE